MANMYRSVLSGGGTVPTGDAVAADVLSGKTFSNANATGITGTMTNNGAVSGVATPSQPYTIPAGYHNGNGVVTAGSGVLDLGFGGMITNTESTYNMNVGDYFLIIIGSATPTAVGLTLTGANIIESEQGTSTFNVSLCQATATTVTARQTTGQSALFTLM